MAAFTLDDIRNAAEAKYGSTDITLADGFVVRLLNPMRLGKTKRDEMLALQKAAEAAEVAAKAAVDAGKPAPESDVDEEDFIKNMLRCVADSLTGVERLFEEFEDDLGALATIFSMYSEGTQLGEASTSQD